MSKVLLNIPDEYLKALDEVAEEKHQTRSELIREAVRKIYYRPRRTPEQQARIEEVGRDIDRQREQWKEPFDSSKIIREMRDSR